MLYDTTFIRVADDYHREQLRRAFRPLLGRRAAKVAVLRRAVRSGHDAVA